MGSTTSATSLDKLVAHLGSDGTAPNVLRTGRIRHAEARDDIAQRYSFDRVAAMWTRLVLDGS